jgi:hypothetical protein
MAARRDNIGLYPCLALMEMSRGLDIPHHLIEHPTIAALARGAADMVTLCNVTIIYY